MKQITLFSGLVLLLNVWVNGGYANEAAQHKTIRKPVFPGTIQIISYKNLFQSPENLLQNPAFSNNTAWQLDTGARIVTTGNNNNPFLEVTTDTQQVQACSEKVRVTAGEEYMLSFDVFTEHGVLDPGWSGKITEESSATDGQEDVLLNGTLHWFTKQGKIIAQTANISYALNNWRRVSKTLTAPPDAKWATVVLTARGNIPNAEQPLRSGFDNIRLVNKTKLQQIINITGKAKQENGSIVLSTSQNGFHINARYSRTDEAQSLGLTHFAQVDISVSGDELPHPFDLIYQRDLTGDVIQYDISRSRHLNENGLFSDATEADFYSELSMSAVPLTTISDQHNTYGLAVELEQPLIFEGQYDSTEARFQTRFSLGLNQQQPEINISVLEMDYSQPMAYRQIWQSYSERLYPDLFATPRPMLGGTVAKSTALFSIDGNSAVPHPDIPDFEGLLADLGIRYVDNGFAADTFSDNQLFDFFASHNVRAFTYDYPWILEHRFAGQSEINSPPDYAEIAEVVHTLSEQLTATTAEQQLKQIKAQHLLHQQNGDLKINRVWAPFFTDGQWSMRIPVVLAGTDYLNTAFEQKYTALLQASDTSEGPVMGMGLDGFMKENKVLNTQPQGDAPFTYDPNTGEIRSLLAASDLSFMQDLRAMLDNQGNQHRLIGGNTTDIGTAMFGWPLLDSATWEADPDRGNNFGHKELNVRRMMMPGKRLEVLLNSDWSKVPAAQLTRFIEHAALLGLYPGLLNRTTPPAGITDPLIQEAVRQIWRQAIPVFDELHQAGWQLITHAEVSGMGSEQVRVERFGKQPPYYFAVLNSHDGIINPEALPEDASISISLDKTALGLTGSTQTERRLGEPRMLMVDDDDEQLTVSFFLKGGRGLVFSIELITENKTPQVK